MSQALRIPRWAYPAIYRSWCRFVWARMVSNWAILMPPCAARLRLRRLKAAERPSDFIPGWLKRMRAGR